MTAPRKKVALLIDTATSWGAGLIEGIAEFAAQRGDWQLFLGPRGKYERMTLPEHWTGDGVIARVTYESLATQLAERGVPAVNVSWYRFGAGRLARCTCDETSIAELGARYFIDRGFRQFAYCGSSIRANYVDRFGEAFTQSLARHGFACFNYAPPCAPDGFLPSAGDLDRLIEWLRELPKPCGLLAFDSLQARQITDACQLARIDVPREIAVLGGEHDHLSCTISKPELSSIDHGPQRVGREAGALLQRIFDGQCPATETVLLSATRVITRQSTDTIAVDDDLLALAAQFIKENSHRRIQVGDLLRAVPISRRALEKGFRKRLGRSPAEEIRRVRVDHAVQLLCDTAWPMPKIASTVGFERPELLTRAFRRELDTTPSEFRRQHHRHHVARPAAAAESN
ncbi:MAG: DNA-binding transcriptional regulator [Planctomycetales bacterium]|nr:DNA-binding transcriptional regulator [Planctomycetales bacterium]